ncbi:TauD/TfdA dioxygenase family protein [Mycobacterium simulans]|uniref:TauD/TfdA dioxygenase family protein n=1 Tax=Mycobacterium simulans TaxID=627089 RepID=UPI0036F34433
MPPGSDVWRNRPEKSVSHPSSRRSGTFQICGTTTGSASGSPAPQRTSGTRTSNTERIRRLAFLYCLVPSVTGGATSFVSTDVDRTGLDSDLVDRLAGLRVVYEPASDHDNIPAVQVCQPALLKSPTSQRRFAYVSENTVEFLGLGAESSAALKRLVLDHLLHPSRVYSHHWSTGDLILYDNAQLMHRREPFEGRRWLKTAKIFAPKDKFAVPAGVR